MTTNGPQRAPLEGITVLDLGQIYSGGYAGLLLALGGATVIKVEPPHGENLRRRNKVGGGAYPFAMLNSNKLGMTLNLKSTEGRDLFKRMACRADVVLENFTPDVMTRLGVGDKELRELNPRLIYACASGYGRDGPYRDFPAMDLSVQAITGVMSVTGYADNPPVKAGPAICDFAAGVHLYAGIVSALYARERTGRGEIVEVTMQEAVYPTLMSSLGLLFSRTDGEEPAWRTGNRHSGNAEAPYNTYQTSDGFVAVQCVTDGHWESLAHLVGGDALASDTRFSSLALRVEHMDELDELVGAWVAALERDVVVELLRRAGVPCAPVNDLAEVVDDPNLWHRKMLQRLDHPEYGVMVAPHSPIRYGYHDRDQLIPSPRLGEHTHEVLTSMLNLPPEEIERLRDSGVVT